MTFNPKDLTDQEIWAVQMERHRRDDESIRADNDRRALLRQAAFSDLLARLREDHPNIAGVTGDELEEIWYEIDDFKEKWDR